MKTTHLLLRSLAAAALLGCYSSAFAATLSPLVDDFSDAQNNSHGVPRQFVNDSVSGGGTTTQQSVVKGILTARGTIRPARGQPGWASFVLLLDPQGLPKDASAFKGVRLIVKVAKGNISLSANSSEVTNFDYHAAAVAAKANAEFQEVRIPFASMKRAWSSQSALDPKTITGLSIVAFDVQEGEFEFEVDEIGFY